ncbi:ATP-binding protein [bacterium]|nr:ATP-binding protein [bacterium]
MNRRMLLNHFGIESQGTYSDDLTRLWTRSLAEDVSDNELIALSGAWGNGKTTLFGQVQGQLLEKHGDDIVFVEVASLDVPRVRIGHIMTAILMDDRIRSSSEPIRRDLEARSLQVIRLLGEAVFKHKKHVCIFIEDAHELHERTILSIKNMREKRYNGRTKFFSVVLIGQPGLAAKVNAFGEVRCRTRKYDLHESEGWMTFERRIDFMRQSFGHMLDQQARKRVAAVRQTMLGIEDMIYTAAAKAWKAGIKTLNADHFEASLLERFEMLKASENISLSDISKAAGGLSKGTVHSVLHGSNRKKDAIESVRRALDAIEDGRGEKTVRVGKMAAAGEG